jgi:hypothetical protein
MRKVTSFVAFSRKVEVIDAKTLRELLDYDPATGIFRWLMDRDNGKIKAGDIAGSYDKGYVRIEINGRKYRAHRLAWLYMTGEWPVGEIDHINRIRDDNRWCNLRDTPHAIGMRNRSLYKNNTSRCVGVYRHRSNGRFYAYITVNGRQIHLGSFPTFEQAVVARFAAEQRYGFSPGHGRRRIPYGFQYVAEAA